MEKGINFISTRCVYEKTLTEEEKDYNKLTNNKPKPDLKIMPYVFDIADVLRYRGFLEDDGTAPFTVIYFAEGMDMTIDVPFDKFDQLYRSLLGPDQLKTKQL